MEEDSQVIAEFGCSIPINFTTTDGVKKMPPGKSDEKDLNEIEKPFDGILNPEWVVNLRNIPEDCQ